MDHRGAVAGDDHRARGGIQVKALPLVLAAVLASTAAHAEPPKLEKIEPPPAARAEAITATAATGILLAATVYTSVRAAQKTSETNELAAMNAEPSQWTAANDSADHWHNASYALVGATIVSVVVTGVLWSRAQPTYQVSVAANPGGGMVGFTSSW
jgi:hypothetical protein